MVRTILHTLKNHRFPERNDQKHNKTSDTATELFAATADSDILITLIVCLRQCVVIVTATATLSTKELEIIARMFP